MSHTPGPWTVRQDDETFGGYWIEEEIEASAHGTHEEAEIRGAANAKLVAAAPDLLAAIQYVLDGFRPWHAQGLRCEVWPGSAMSQVMEDAVAKATGEAS